MTRLSERLPPCQSKDGHCKMLKWPDALFHFHEIFLQSANLRRIFVCVLLLETSNKFLIEIFLELSEIDGFLQALIFLSQTSC